MLFRTLQKGSCLLAGKNVGIYVNPSNSPVRLIWGLTSTHTLGVVKSGISPLGVIPRSLQCAVRVKMLTWTTVRNGLKKTCNFSKYRKISKVLWRKNLAFSESIRKSSWGNVLSVFQKLFRCSLKGSKNVTRIALGSALFVPSTFFTNSEVKKGDEKIMPIEIPKETRKPKSTEPLLRLLVDMYDFLRLFLRGLRLFITFAPLLTLYPMTYLGEKPADVWWGLVLRAIEFSGPIVIKLGQWASTRRDLFPESCCRQFARLHRRIQPHSWSFTVYRMRKAFGPNWRKVFVKFDNNRNPVGSGCVAQVYKVWMSQNAIADELLEEIISDMDDENDPILEGLEVQGFRKIFGFDDDLGDKPEEQSIEEWRQQRNKQSLKEKEKDFLAKETEAESGRALELDVSSVTESLASEMINGDGFNPLIIDLENKEVGGGEDKTLDAEDAEAALTEHSLLEVWEEADHDKSFPFEEAPPDDLDGLVPVALKVLHPSVFSCFRRDLRILRACACFITFVYPPLRWLSLPQCVDEFAEVMSGQINLKMEAENLERFSENFSDVTSVKFPRPLRPYVTQTVLVETYEDGEGMGEFIGSSGEDKPNDLRIHLAQIGVDALLKMVFLDNLVHGDLHPGNILVQNINLTEDGTTTGTSGDVSKLMLVDVGCDTFVMDVQPDPNPLRICILDCGVVARLKDHDLVNFKAVFKQVVLGDGESVANLFLENSEHNCKDPEGFKAEMTKVVENARQNTISLAQVDVGVLLQQVLGILLRHEVRLESAFSAIVLAVFVLEGLGRTLNPNMDILERARPMLVT